MPKYIKVLVYNEFSVFEVIEEYEKTIKCKLTVCENGYIVISKNNVISKADNLAELCDRFVLKDCDIIILNKEHTQYHFEESDEWFDITDVELRKGICGAIWTEKGLIYVAKMDSEGKLVLI